MFRYLLLVFIILQHHIGITQQIEHIAIPVKHLATANNFYRKVLQLDTIANPFNDGKHTWYRLTANVQLHVIALAQPFSPPVKHQHICLRIRDMNAFISNLNQHNIPFEDWPGKPQQITTRPDGVHQIYIQDPDGYWWEINDAP
jgi:catechol 2,3-dioxygenase-like lactoylglutathione lyase family enzyme